MAEPLTLPAETRSVGEAAWDLIRVHGTTADPVAYAVWFAYARNSHPGLVSDLAAKLALGSPSDADLRDIHKRHLAEETEGVAIGRIARHAQDELASALDALRTGAGDIGSGQADLRRALTTLTNSAFSQSDLQATLMAVAAASGRIADSNKALMQRLRSSEQRIAGLETDLGAARVQTLTDGLTGLSNRRAFDEHLASVFDRAGRSAVLAMIDIDHFKAFNDKYGHVIGDQVIRFVASTLKETFPSPILTARYGGEEFAIIMPDHDSGEAARTLESLRERIGFYELVQRGTNLPLGRVTISLGATTMRADDTPVSFVSRADEHLYAAKRSGRNRLTFLS